MKAGLCGASPDDADDGPPNSTSCRGCDDHASAETVGEPPWVGIGEEEGSGGSDRGGNGDPYSGAGLERAMLDAAEMLALRFSIPGLSEAAGLITVLVERTVDTPNSSSSSSGSISSSMAGGTAVTVRTTMASQSKLQWCRSVLEMLKRAGDVLGQVG